MFSCIVVRCQNGVVVWDEVHKDIRTYSWVCARDQFAVPMPTSTSDVERCLLAIASHSAGLAGSILQVVELNV